MRAQCICTHCHLQTVCILNPLHANFLRGNKNIYLRFVSFLHCDMTQVAEILPQVRKELTYSRLSISWVLMSWRLNEPGHQQSRYELCWIELIQSPHVKGYFPPPPPPPSVVAYASLNRVNIGSGNYLSFVRRQAITWVSAGLLSIGLLETNLSEIQLKKYKICIHAYGYENVVCEMATISSKGRWVN